MFTYCNEYTHIVNYYSYNSSICIIIVIIFCMCSASIIYSQDISDGNNIILFYIIFMVHDDTVLFGKLSA